MSQTILGINGKESEGQGLDGRLCCHSERRAQYVHLRSKRPRQIRRCWRWELACKYPIYRTVLVSFAHDFPSNLKENACPVGTIHLSHSLAHALPPPGYNRQRPHCMVLTLANGGVYFFQAGTEELVN